MEEAFKEWLLETYNEEFNEKDINHVIKKAIFQSGYYAGYDEAKDH